MKRILTLICAAVIVLSLGAVFTACEGPAGPAGKDGLNGSNGTNGTDGNATCGVCHNSGTVMYAKMLQYENSVHFTGGDIEGDRGNPCVSCHTSEGFTSRVISGQDTATSVPANPTPVNCRTCHMIHTNYDTTDWNLRDTNAVALQINKSLHVDFGKGNLCSMCHQPRLPSPLPLASAGSDSITITSNRWGLHHGPQSALLAGIAGYEFAGGTFGSSRHKTAPNGCITCHMSTSLNLTAGGHTFKAGYTDATGNRAWNLSACTSCHSGGYAITATTVLTNENAIDTLVIHLQKKLIADKLLNASTLLPNVVGGSSKSPTTRRVPC